MSADPDVSATIAGNIATTTGTKLDPKSESSSGGSNREENRTTKIPEIDNSLTLNHHHHPDSNSSYNLTPTHSLTLT